MGNAIIACFAWVAIGILAGAMARRLMGARDKPLWNDLLLGLIGAFIGGIVTSLFNIDTGDIGNSKLADYAVSFGVATIGAAILIFVGRSIFGDERKRRRRRKKR